METQKCSKCGLDKELNSLNYYKDRARKSGFKPECKECTENSKEKFVYTCTFCGEEIISRKKYTENKFCNKKCRGAFNKTLVGEMSPQYKGFEREKICPICNKLYVEHVKGATQTCSYECSAIYRQKRVSVVCKFCSVNFEKRESEIYWHKQRGHEFHFCTRVCKDNYHTGENSHVWVEDRSKLKNIKHSIRFSRDMKQWRTAVYERDNYTCKMCGDKSREGNHVTLNAHHIKKFNDYPKLRAEINNGITLCEPCHKKTYCKEEDFEQEFYLILKGDKDK